MKIPHKMQMWKCTICTDGMLNNSLFSVPRLATRKLHINTLVKYEES